MKKLCFLFTFLVLLVNNPADALENDNLNQQIELIGVTRIEGTARDLSGLATPLFPRQAETQTFANSKPLPAGAPDAIPEPNVPRYFSNMFGGISAVDYCGNDNLYYFLPDRGPLDGAIAWPCRVQKVRVEFGESAGSEVQVEVVETIFLRDENGNAFTGLASAYKATQQQPARLDPEGIRIAENGNFFVSDEYGPRLIEFSSTGEFVREFEMPGQLVIHNPGLTKSDENPQNVAGRQTNRGMEGLAISPDGQKLFGLMQSSLLQDSYRADLSKRPNGLNVRLELFSTSGKFAGERLYRLDQNSNGLNEILACGAEQFIVIERDGKPGAEAKFKKLMLVSMNGASEISNYRELPSNSIPTGVQPVQKSVLIDLLDPKWALTGDSMPEKIESLAFGPDLPDGRKTLLVVSDNDFEPDCPTCIYVFAIPNPVSGK